MLSQAEEVLDDAKDEAYDYPEEEEVLALSRPEIQTPCLTLKGHSVRIPLSTFEVCLLVGCLTSQQHVSVSQGWMCSDNFTCCHTEVEVADQTFHLTQSQYTDTGATSPSTDPLMPDAWQGSHWSANF